MANMVVRTVTGVIGWFLQVIAERVLNDKYDKFTNKRPRVGLQDDIDGLKSQLRKAHCVLVTAKGTQIMNKYLLLSVKDLEELACAAKKLLDDSGSCSCIKDATDRSNKVGREIKPNKSEKTLFFSKRNVIPHSETIAFAISCEICSGDIENTENRTKKRKLDGDDTSHRMREIADKLKDTRDHVQGELQLEMLGNLVRETQYVSTMIGAAICEDEKLTIDQERKEVSRRKENIPGSRTRIRKRRQRCSDIKNLNITGYNGSIPPTQLDAKLPDLTNLETLHLKDFKNLKVLPPLGQLPHLKNLSLINLSTLKEVNSEFYGDGSIKGFPSLQELYVHDLPECGTWAGRDDCVIFPRLEKFTLTDCPELERLPCDCANQTENKFCFPCLKKLFIYNCPKLILPARPRAHVLSEEGSTSYS